MISSPPHRPNEHGFTLIELLVSTTILAMVMGLVALSVQVMSDGWYRGGQAATTHDMLGRASDILRRDLRGARRPVILAGKKPVFLFAGTDNAMTYVVREPPYPTAAGLSGVRLSQRTIAGRQQLVRSRRRYDPEQALDILDTGAQRTELSDAVVLIEGPFEIDLSYHDGTTKGTWQNAWSDSQSMPVLIKVRFTTAGNTQALPDIVATLNVNAELACLRSGNNNCTIQSKGKLPDGKEKKPPAKKADDKLAAPSQDR